MSAVSRQVGWRAGGRQLEGYQDRTGHWSSNVVKGTGQRRRSIFHLSCSFALLHSHSQSTHTHSSAHLECFDMALWAWPGRQLSPCGQHNNGSRSKRATKATARHVIKRKRCLWPHVASSSSSCCCCSCSVSILAWRMSSVAAAAVAPAASYLQPLEGSVFCREKPEQDAPRPCAAITRRRKHLNVFMWKLLSPRPSRATQATTKMFPLLS